MSKLTLQQLKDKLQNLCYQGHSQRKVMMLSTEKSTFVDASDIEYQLLNGDSIYLGLFESNGNDLVLGE